MLVYTDGGKRKNKGAYAFCFVDAHPNSIGQDYAGRASGKILDFGCGFVPDFRSSAHSEVYAAYAALLWLVEKGMTKNPITFISDSTYVTQGLVNPFKMAKNNVNYHDLWMQILRLTMFMEITTVHVRGHQKQTFNSFCDFMCNTVFKLDNEQDAYASGHRHMRLMNSSNSWRRSLIRSHK